MSGFSTFCSHIFIFQRVAAQKPPPSTYKDYMATVGFGLESANVVGYNGAALRGGNQAAGAGASFVNVDDTDLTLANLKVVGYNAEDGYAEFEVVAKKLNGAGVGGTSYFWCDFEEEGETYYGWYDEDMNDYNDVELAAGESLWIYSPSTDFSVVFPAPVL